MRSVHIVGQPGGWAALIHYGRHERPLAAQRSRQVRLFRKLDVLVTYLRRVGIVHFEVNAANFDADTLKTNRRPDRSAVLKKTHEAAAYDQWFREQVQVSLDDPRPSVPDATVRAAFATRKAALRQPPE